jgi:hypothetical protein
MVRITTLHVRSVENSVGTENKIGNLSFKTEESNVILPYSTFPLFERMGLRMRESVLGMLCVYPLLPLTSTAPKPTLISCRRVSKERAL